ncbi:MAG TPA: cytochrome c biogenesis protein ResB, partial [Dissulfurispiraceae bacterium]
MDKDKKEQSIVDRVWNFFSSITLAVVVFTAISATSIVGTILEQQAAPERNIKLLSKFFGGAAPGAFRVLDALGFTNMYHSWWFLSLLFVFAANLVICSLDRLPKIWKLVKEPVSPLTPEQFKVMPIKRELSLKGKPGDVKASVGEALGKAGFKASFAEEGDTLQFYAEKGRFSRLGVYVTHFSILMILVGAVIGMLFGFNGGINLPEGVTSPFAYTGDSVQIPLGFEVRCDQFEVSFYDNSDAPKAYRSWLTVLDNGKEVMKKQIDVNNPLKYKGITFYQASYGYSPTKDSLFRFNVTSNNGKSEKVERPFGGTFDIPGTNVVGKIENFSPALGQDESGRLYTYAEMMNNPAVLVAFTENGKPKYKQWILKRYPQTWRVPDGTVEFKTLWGAQYTGLQVRKDPGVWIVYLG